MPQDNDNTPAVRSGAPPSPVLSPRLTRVAFRAEVLSLAWEPLVLLLLAPLERTLRPWVTAPPIDIDTAYWLYLASLLWAVLYIIWMLPVTLVRRWWLPRQVGLVTPLARELARCVRILAARAAVVYLLVIGVAAVWSALGATAAGIVLAVPALLVVLVQRSRPTSEPASTTKRTLPELQQFAARSGFPEVAVRRANSTSAPLCSLDVHDGRSVITLSPALLEAAPAPVLRGAVAHELAHHQASDVRRASLLGELAIVSAVAIALAVLRVRVGPEHDWSLLLDALPWALFACWLALTAAFLAIRAWERRRERRANLRAMELADDPADVAAAVAMVSAVPPRNAGLMERTLWRMLSSHPDPATVSEDARARAISRKSQTSVTMAGHETPRRKPGGDNEPESHA